jgi:hypothetical protein
MMPEDLKELLRAFNDHAVKYPILSCDGLDLGQSASQTLRLRVHRVGTFGSFVTNCFLRT